MADAVLLQTALLVVWMHDRAAGLGRSVYSMMGSISVEVPSSQTAGLFLQLTAFASKLCILFFTV